MNDKECAQTILEKVGRADNLLDFANCMTRLRMHLKDPEKIDQEALRNTEGVLGIVLDENYLQVVLGPGKVSKVADEMRHLIGSFRQEEDNADKKIGNWETNKAEIHQHQKQNKTKESLQLLSSIFVPMIPAVIGSGLFNGFASLLSQMLANGTLAGNFWNMLQLLFSLFGASFLSYFAIYTGIQAAKVFGATPTMGGMIGAISIGSQIVDISTMMGLYNTDVPLKSILTTGKGGIIGVIIGVWILAVIEKWIRRHVPDAVNLIVTPFCSLLIAGTLFVFVIMPAAGFLSDWLVAFLSFFINSSHPIVSIFSGYIMAAVFLPMVLLGLHHGLIPLYSIQLEAMGGISLFPVLACAGAGQVGAAAAIYLLARKVGNEKLQTIIAGALPAGIMGVGEPLIYGVTLPMGKPFLTAGLGAGFGGAYVMMMHVTASAWGPSGVVAIPLMQSTASMLHYFIGLCIACAAGFVITLLLIKPASVKNAQ